MSPGRAHGGPTADGGPRRPTAARPGPPGAAPRTSTGDPFARPPGPGVPVYTYIYIHIYLYLY